MCPRLLWFLVIVIAPSTATKISHLIVKMQQMGRHLVQRSTFLSPCLTTPATHFSRCMIRPADYSVKAVHSRARTPSYCNSREITCNYGRAHGLGSPDVIRVLEWSHSIFSNSHFYAFRELTRIYSRTILG